MTRTSLRSRRWKSVCFIQAITASAGFAQTMEWASPSSGSWHTATNWAPQNIPDNGAETAVLGLSGAYAVSMGTNTTLGGLSLTNPDATLHLNAGRAMFMSGPLGGDGTIVVNNSGANSGTYIRFDVNQTLTGSGQIILNANFNNYDTGYVSTLNNTVVTVGPDFTIRGLGRMYGRYILAGTVLSDDQFGGRIELRDGQMTGSGTGAVVLDGGWFNLNNSTLTGVPVTASGDEEVRTYGNSYTTSVDMESNLTVISGTLYANALDVTGDVTISPNSNMVVQSPNLTVDGAILINDTGAANSTYLNFQQTGALLGTGDLILNANMSNLDTGYVWVSNNSVLTVGEGRTIRGLGRLYGRYTLEGTVLSDDQFGGRIQLISGQMTGTGDGSIVIDAGDFELNNATISSVPVTTIGSGQLRTYGSCSMNTATVEAYVRVRSGSLNANNLSVTGDVQVAANTNMIVQSPNLTVVGDISINDTGAANSTYLNFQQSGSLLGTGDLILNANLSNFDTGYVSVSNNGILTIGEGRTVRGLGRLYGRYVLAGTVLSDDQFGGGIQLVNGQMTGSGSGAVVLDGGFFSLYNATLTGAPVTAMADEQVLTHGTSYLTNLPMNADLRVDSGILYASNLSVTGNVRIDAAEEMVVQSPNLTVEGDILINDTGAPNSTYLNFQQTGSLLGTGDLILNANLSNYDTGYVSVSNNSVLTIGEGRTIRGGGRFYGSTVVEGAIAPEVYGVEPTSSIEFRSTLVLASTATVDLEVAGVASSDYDRLTGAAAKTLGGTLRVALIDGFIPPRDTVFNIITGTSITGQFDTLDLPATWHVVYTPTATKLVYNCVADFNGDGMIDFFDVQAYLDAYSADAPEADLNNDGILDFFDLLFYLAAFSEGCP